MNSMGGGEDTNIQSIDPSTTRHGCLPMLLALWLGLFLREQQSNCKSRTRDGEVSVEGKFLRKSSASLGESRPSYST